MKKIYISPEFLLIELRCTEMLAESIGIGEGTADDGGWVKEESTSTSNKSIWDDEW